MVIVWVAVAIGIVVIPGMAIGKIRPGRQYFYPNVDYHEPWIIRLLSWITDGGK